MIRIILIGWGVKRELILVKPLVTKKRGIYKFTWGSNHRPRWCCEASLSPHVSLSLKWSSVVKTWTQTWTPCVSPRNWAAHNSPSGWRLLASSSHPLVSPIGLEIQALDRSSRSLFGLTAVSPLNPRSHHLPLSLLSLRIGAFAGARGT